MVRVVLDTNIVVRASLTPGGPPATIVELALRGVFTLTVLTDDEDNRLLECAEAAQADFLVTGNRKHFPAFLHRTRIITAREFLTELGF